MAHWHALAKLRLHTDKTLEVLDTWTSVMGEAARTFVTSTCSQFVTSELKREYEARKRREARASANVKGKRKGQTKKDVEGGSSIQPGVYSLLNSPFSLNQFVVCPVSMSLTSIKRNRPPRGWIET